ncbi:MAG: transposon-encoded TnpW family protein [Lachnospiraceae bacterium]|nr:transposon-encoded TnpW family protein [Lachnospiraceae bacterium]
MNTEKTTISTDATQQENDRPALVKKIGNTIYEVSFYFSTTSNETMNDKIKRLIKRDADLK